ncbi:MAG TPA: GNAT family N-acetyltransferase [Chitinophagaceae bacterium]|nr:GNAT family N-acetyltransferase [Chitinophagaceae bacterium]
MSSSFKIREATAGDVSVLAALHVTTFNETHGPGPTYEVRKWQWEKAFKDTDNDWFCFVVQNENGNLVGFAKGQRYNDSDMPDFSGELNKIYVLSRYQQLGLGRQLICKVANQFAKRGISSMLLFGDANSRSNGFYEKMGAERLFTKKGEFHGGYGWKDLQKLLANC